MSPENKAANIATMCTALGNVGRDMIAAGIAPEALAAGWRNEAAKIEALGYRPSISPDEAEMLDLLKRTHEFINSLQVAGIDERIAIVTMGNALIERVARSKGAAGTVEWLQGLARNVEANAEVIEATAGHH